MLRDRRWRIRGVSGQDLFGRTEREDGEASSCRLRRLDVVDRWTRRMLEKGVERLEIPVLKREQEAQV
jgi:hypothetical protein